MPHLFTLKLRRTVARRTSTYLGVSARISVSSIGIRCCGSVYYEDGDGNGETSVQTICYVSLNGIPSGRLGTMRMARVNHPIVATGERVDTADGASQIHGSIDLQRHENARHSTPFLHKRVRL